MSHILRNFRALRRVGPLEYLRQIWIFGEFRGGELVGTDRIGNKYFEIRDDPNVLFCTLINVGTLNSNS